jgi:lysozyme family protein
VHGSFFTTINRNNMADFNLANPHVIANEGGYVNDPSDSGGETYRGVSRNNYPNWQGWQIVDAAKPLKRGQIINNDTLDTLVNDFYKVEFWDSMKGDAIKDQSFASYFYDFYITSRGNAVKRLQKVIGISPQFANFGLVTLTAVNLYKGDLLAVIHKARCDYYKEIGVGHNAKFLNGWLNRANNLYAKLK